MKSESRAGYYESPSKTFSPTQSSQDGSSKKRNQPLFPATIRQLLNAQQVTPDADDFLLNGHPLTQVCLIGQIVNSQPTSTHLNYSVDDSTGAIDVRIWVDAESPQKNQHQWNHGDYVRVVGNLRSFGEKRYVVSSSQMLQVIDYNELTHHFLEIIHLTLTLSGRRSTKAGSSTSNAMDMPSNSAYYKQPTTTNNNNSNSNALNELQSEITNLVRQNNPTGDGIDIAMIVNHFAEVSPEETVRTAIAFLIDEGHLYNTTDGDHVGATDEY